MTSMLTHDTLTDQTDLYLGTVFHWLFGGSWEEKDQNVEQLKNNVDILMANQNVHQKQIKETFKLNNLTRIETTQN